MNTLEALKKIKLDIAEKYLYIKAMKIITLTQTSLLVLALTSCSTLKQANKDFKNCYKTIVDHNFPVKKTGWNITCDYCMPTQKCKWYKCPNKNK